MKTYQCLEKRFAQLWPFQMLSPMSDVFFLFLSYVLSGWVEFYVSYAFLEIVKDKIVLEGS